MTNHLTQELGNFIAGHPAGSLPDSTREAISLLVLDLMAAVGAGVNSDLARSARQAAVEMGGSGKAGVWMTGLRLDIASAAMANAAAASALDIDDGHRGAAGHAGAGVIPAALAVAEALGSDDEAILDAIALGYDNALRLATARPVASIRTYSSGLWVGFGVVAAVARLLRLDAAQCANALAIIAAEGPISYDNGRSRMQGTSVKEMIPTAVTAGISAAFRARHGATGPLDLLDTPELYTRAIATADLGRRWWLEECYLKPYAACRYMHAAVDAILELRREGAEIRQLQIETFPRGLSLSNERRPASLEAGQYSFPFTCALAAIHGEEALQPVRTASLHDPRVLELAARVELIAHPDFAESFPAGTPCRVILDQGDGPQTRTVLSPRGESTNPLSRSQVRRKFRAITQDNIDDKSQMSMLSALDGLLTQGFGALFTACANMSEPHKKQNATNSRSKNNAT